MTYVLQVAVEAELRELDLQANSLRKQHDKLVQDRLSSASRLAQLRDSLKVCFQMSSWMVLDRCEQQFCINSQKISVMMQDLNTDSQLVFQESPGSRLVKQLQQKLAVALTKHDAAQNTCQSLEDTAQQLREHRQTHESQVSHLQFCSSCIMCFNVHLSPCVIRTCLLLTSLLACAAWCC